ncbi:MAG: tetratricopeptide repeat protein [Candidatus Latescibacteria bacterium]|nr:tetratricopeptide repeat protein [Candidatus Latescibacterota bacterium]
MIGILLAIGWAAAATAQDPQALYEEGLRAQQGRRMAAAATAYAEAIAADSTFYQAYLGLAQVHMARNNRGAAEAVLRGAVRQDSSRIEALFELGKLLQHQDRRQAAYELFAQVVQLRPEAAAGYTGIGRLRMQPDGLMDLDEAARAFTRVRALQPDNLEALFNLGRVQAYRGNWPAAAQVYRDLLQRRPVNFPTMYQLGMVHYFQGDFAVATQVLEQAVDLGGDALIPRWALFLAHRSLAGDAGDLPLALQWREATGPTRPPQWRDGAPGLGLDRRDGGMGSAWSDCDGDGDLDLFAAGARQPVALYRNQKGRFTEATSQSGLVGEGAIGNVFGDFDNDGDPDLYLARNGWMGGAPNSLWRNEGDCSFVDISQEAGVDDGGSSLAAAWADLDLDGHLDLVVTNGINGDGSPDRLYHGDGNGTFAEVGAAAGLQPGPTAGLALGDYDNDGDQDLYLARFKRLNAFYRNDSQIDTLRFQDISRESRAQVPLGAYWPLFFDFDNDGDLDLFCSEMSDYNLALYSRSEGRNRFDRHRPALFRNDGDGTFTDWTYKAGLGRSLGTTEANVADVDGDGFMDIYLSNGGAEMNRLEPDVLLLNRGDGTFAAGDIWDQLGKGHGSAFGDFDGDGDPDLYLPIGGVYPGEVWANKLWRNEYGGHWLTLRLVGTYSNRDALGSRVRVRAEGRDRYYQVSSRGGNSLQLDVGVGTAQIIEEIEVRWPTGAVQVLRNVEADQVLVMEELR